MREAMDLISLIGMAQSIQRCGHIRSECKLGFENTHAGSRTRVTSMGGLWAPLDYMRLARFIRLPPHGQAAF
jgi:hypothetical protein